MTLTPDDVPAREAMELGQRWGQRLDEHARKTATEVATEIADEKVIDHEERMHLPPRRTDPVTAVPFAGQRLEDPVTCQAIELLRKGHTLEDVATFLDVEAMVLERAIADYRPPYRNWLYERALS